MPSKQSGIVTIGNGDLGSVYLDQDVGPITVGGTLDSMYVSGTLMGNVVVEGDSVSEPHTIYETENMMQNGYAPGGVDADGNQILSQVKSGLPDFNDSFRRLNSWGSLDAGNFSIDGARTEIISDNPPAGYQTPAVID